MDATTKMLKRIAAAKPLAGDAERLDEIELIIRPLHEAAEEVVRVRKTRRLDELLNVAIPKLQAALRNTEASE